MMKSMSNANASTLPIRIVLLVSEQLTPALEFVLHAAHRWGRQLQAVHLYCTKDVQRSIEPANRLQHSLQRWLKARGLPATVTQVQGGVSPDEVREGLLQCFEAAPDCHWLVNVTGGNKIMSAAAIEFSLATDLPSCRVLYKEIDGQWLQLSLRPEDEMLHTQVLHAAHDVDVPPVQTLDTLLSVEELVRVQFSEQHHQTSQAVLPMPLLPALLEVEAQAWDWRAAYPLMPNVKAVSGGDGFERFIAAGLQACGMRVRHSLKIHDTAASHKPVREIDVVACHRGRLVCIDIKLPNAEQEAKGTQLADIADLARKLGGSAALGLALRPGWPADTETTRLAKALNVRVLTQDDAPQVFTQLLQAIDKQLALPAEVLAVETQLQAWAKLGYPVLSDRRHLVASRAVSEAGLLSVSHLLQDIAPRQQRGWVLAHLPSGDVLVWIDKKSSHNPAWTLALENRVLNCLRGLGQWQALSNGTAIFSGLLRHPKPKELEQHLRQLLGTGFVGTSAD